MDESFRKFSRTAAHAMGSTWAFLIAVGIVLVWASLGPGSRFSATWQLVINTGTTIVTFLMVFLIQNTQNRDSTAIHLKLDELLSATQARSEFVDVEDAPDKELKQHQEEFAALRKDFDPHLDLERDSPTVQAK
jgi:low affinity Fe/Cu permease